MNKVMPVHGNPSTTITMTASDVVQSIAAANLTNADSKAAISALITCETYNIRFTCSATNPTQAGLGHLLLANQSLKISNPSALRNFKFINAVNGSNAILQISIEFEIGV